MIRTSFLRVRALALIALLAPTLACAQAYPNKPVRLVIPYPAGGTTDLLARPVVQKLATLWGQPVVIDNRGGATGIIGTEIIAKSAPDGYNLLMHAGALAISVTLDRKLPFDAVKELSPVTNVAMTPFFLFANADLPASSVKELISLAQAAPGKLAYASTGVGSTPHLTAEMFNLMARTRLLHVPYKGAGPAMSDLVSGQVQIFFVGLPTAQQFVKAGRLKVLGVADSKRSSFYPNVPTIAEAGVPDFAAENWFGIFAPAGTPPEIERKIAEGFATVLKAPEIREQLAVLGGVPSPSSPQEFKSYFAGSVATWAKVIRERNIRAEP